MRIREDQGAPTELAQTAEMKFQRLVECLPAGAYICDAEGLITYFNRQAVQLWGRTPRLNDARDRFCGSFKLYSPEGVPIAHDQCWMALALQTGTEYSGQEIVIEQPDGKRITVLAHANPLHDAAGRLRGAINVLVDISDRKRQEELLKQADRAKDEFLAMVSHELRTPLNAILGWTRIAQRDARSTSRALEIIERNARHQAKLIDDLLDLSRMVGGKLGLETELVDIPHIITAAADSLRLRAEARSVALELGLEAELPLVVGDSRRLQQVICNLLENSIKFTPSGGRVVLTAGYTSSKVEIRISDNGKGISSEFLPHLFEAFRQGRAAADRSGLGLGLAIVRYLVELHGGAVQAHSEGEGKGAVFTVTLPSRQDAAVSAAPRPTRATSGAASPRPARAS